METRFEPPDPAAERFVGALIETGLAFVDTLSDLLESLEGRDPWPGEDPGQVLLDMTAGSIQLALTKVPDDEVESATELIECARERFVADLRLATEISGRRESMRR